MHFRVDSRMPFFPQDHANDTKEGHSSLNETKNTVVPTSTTKMVHNPLLSGGSTQTGHHLKHLAFE
jgi:hypothetical protein